MVSRKIYDNFAKKNPSEPLTEEEFQNFDELMKIDGGATKEEIERFNANMPEAIQATIKDLDKLFS